MSFLDAFVMPQQVTIMARTSSITNSFVNGIIPCIAPTEDEVTAALSVLGMDEDTVVCAYCGNPMTEWDHLNPLVKNKRPTGFVSEIHNLVPSCGKCNQSKGNKPWRDWIVSGAKKSPLSRGVPDLEERIRLLEEYERAFEPKRLNFEAIVDPDLWSTHWRNLERIHDLMQQCQEHSDLVMQAIADSAAKASPSLANRTGVSEHGHDAGHGQPLPSRKSPRQTSRPSTVGKRIDDVQFPPGMEGIDKVANKKFAFRCLSYLESHSTSLESDLRLLCNEKECKAAFGHGQALLKCIDGIAGQARAREDENGYPRYYKDSATLLGRRFFVSKEWYGLGEKDRDNRTPFLRWVLSR